MTDFARDTQGVVWAGANRPGNSGLWRFDGSSWQNVGEQWKIPEQPVAQVGFDREGNLWVLSGRRGRDYSNDLHVFLPASAVPQSRRRAASQLWAGMRMGA